jgi:hypothetical protein
VAEQNIIEAIEFAAGLIDALASQITAHHERLESGETEALPGLPLATMEELFQPITGDILKAGEGLAGSLDKLRAAAYRANLA